MNFAVATDPTLVRNQKRGSFDVFHELLPRLPVCWMFATSFSDSARLRRVWNHDEANLALRRTACFASMRRQI